MVMTGSLQRFFILLLPACCVVAPGNAQHNPGNNCFDCHTEYRMAGTVFSDSNGTTIQSGIPVSLITADGSEIALAGTNESGNIAEPIVPDGTYLVEVGAVRSRTWHTIPGQGNCNSCHVLGGNAGGERTKRFRNAPYHTRIPPDNDCTHCHHFPASMSLPQLITPYVLHTTPLVPPEPGSQVDILGEVFPFDADEYAITTVRPDIFADGYYSMFDVLLAVAERNGIAVEYTYDETRKTHFISTIDNVPGEYWYHFSYDTGIHNQDELRSRRANRWDETLWRPGVWVQVVEGENLQEIKAEYLEEIERESTYGHMIPNVIVSLTPSDYMGNPPNSGRITVMRNFTNVQVMPHNLRSVGYPSPYSKPFQTGVVTSLDVPLSLMDLGQLTLLTSVFYNHLAHLYIESYYVVAMGFPDEGTAHASGKQGFVYTTENGSPARLPNDADIRFHITSDIAVLHAPDFSRWRWAELGNPYYEPGDPTSVEDPSVLEDFDAIARGFNLHAPFPNPFNGSARITFNIFEPGAVRIEICDQTGQRLSTVYNQRTETIGIHEVTWDPTHLSSGVYYIVMKYEKQMQVRRIVYLR